MTYIPGNPLTGFTLEIDGDIDVIDRIARAVTRAMQEEIQRVDREQRKVWLGGPIETWYEIRRLVPFEGTITLRTSEKPLDVAGVCPNCGRVPGDPHLVGCPFERL